MHAPATERTVTVLKTLAHPLRLGIVGILCERDENVTGLADRLEVPRSAVSSSLALMRMLHIVAVTRRNGHATYRLEDDGVRGLISWARGSRASPPRRGRVPRRDPGARLRRRAATG